MQPALARRLAETARVRLLQDLADGEGRLDDAAERDALRVEVDDQVSPADRATARGQFHGLSLDAAEVGQVEQRRLVLAEDVLGLHFAAGFGRERHGLDPTGGGCLLTSF